MHWRSEELSIFFRSTQLVLQVVGKNSIITAFRCHVFFLANYHSVCYLFYLLHLAFLPKNIFYSRLGWAAIKFSSDLESFVNVVAYFEHLECFGIGCHITLS